MKLPTIKRKLPDVFTDENNYFGKDQSGSIRGIAAIPASCTASFSPSRIYLQWWWIVPYSLLSD